MVNMHVCCKTRRKGEREEYSNSDWQHRLKMLWATTTGDQEML